MLDTLDTVDSYTQFRQRPKAVIGHPKLGFGGSESVVMWLIEALKRDFEVTVMTTGGWDLAALNAFYGTQVSQYEVQVRIAPVPWPLRSLNAAALRGACYQRFARQIAREYDLRISAYNPTDWGLPAVHLLADFSWHSQLRKLLDPRTPGFVYQDTIARKAYLKLSKAFENPSGRNLFRDDLLIANSRWSASLVKQHCGVDCAAVIDPPVWEEFPSVPWDEREQAFVIIGRIAPEKRIEQAIEILQRVRQHGHPIKLHLCGKIESDTYGNTVSQLCRRHADWIILEGLVSGAKKSRILTHCRFGIQMRGAEPFGISVAEMIKAGAIVFAPAQGGQVEILGDPSLLFSTTNEAVDKILAALENSSLQSALRTHLAHRAHLFSAQRFVHEVRSFITNPAMREKAEHHEVAGRTS